MRKVKIFPAPHTEVRIHVSEKMEEDMKECFECARNGKVSECESCEWNDVDIKDTPLCTMEEIRRKVLGEV